MSGVVTDEWPTSRLGDLIVAKYGKGLSKATRHGGDVPVYGSNGVIGQHDEAITKGPAIVIGRKGSSGAVNCSPTACWPIDTTYYIDEPGPYTLEFLDLLLRSLGLEHFDRSTAIPGLNRDVLYAIEVPVPPRGVQDDLVRLIARNTELGQSAGSHLAAARKATERFRRAVLAAACSGRLTAGWRDLHADQSGVELAEELAQTESKRTKRTWKPLGDRFDASSLPNTWGVGAFGTLTENFDGRRVPVKGTDRARRQGPYPYYGASGVIDSVDGYLFDGDYLLISEDGANLLARATPIAFRAHGQFWVNNHAHIVQGRRGVLDEYLEVVINGRDVQDYVTGSAQPKLTQAALSEIPVPVPPTDEQSEIVRRVSRLVASADGLLSRLDVASQHVGRSSQAVLAKAFRGELSVVSEAFT